MTATKGNRIMRKSSALWAAAITLVGAQALADTTDWAIDPAHTHVGFTVPHMVVSEVDGEFKTFSGKVALDEKDPTKSQLDFSIDVASVNTDAPDRDKHLRSPDFFDAEKFPKITFTSKKITKAGKGYKVKGDLTIRGVTKEVTLDATLSEAIQNPWGKLVRAAHVTGKVKRQDFGVSWNKSLDKGGVVVGDDVTIDIKLELNK
jgi:polyisoprenoid-binding protein YceI